MIRHSYCRGRAAAAAAAVCVGMVGASAPGQVSYTLVADTSQTAPGTTRKFTNFELPAIAADGRVAFMGSVQSAPGDLSPKGIWSGAPGAVSLVARSTTEAPGGDGATFSYFTTIHFGAEGTLLYGAQLQGAGVGAANDRGAWLTTGPGPGTLVAREGAPVPGEPAGTTFGEFQAGGTIAGDGTLRLSLPVRTPAGTELSTSYVGAPGQRQILNRQGDAAPGLPNEVFLNAGAGLPLGADGSLFHAVLATTTTPTRYRHSLWAGKPGAITPVALVGTPAPVGDPRATYGGNIFQVHSNSAGQVAFLSQLAYDGTVDYNTVHLFSGTPGNVQRRLSEGDAVPGVPGTVFNDFDEVTLGRTGGLTFYARISGPGDSDSLWSLRENVLRLIARENEPAPGVTDGATFGRLIDGTHATNAAGQIVLASKLRGAGVTDANDLALFLTDPHGDLTLIAREGFALPGEANGKVVSSLFWTQFQAVTGGDEGLSTALNDAGQLAFTAQFTDGSRAVYVAHVPEPGAAAVLGGVALVALVTGRGGRRGR